MTIQLLSSSRFIFLIYCKCTALFNDLISTCDRENSLVSNLFRSGIHFLGAESSFSVCECLCSCFSLSSPLSLGMTGREPFSLSLSCFLAGCQSRASHYLSLMPIFCHTDDNSIHTCFHDMDEIVGQSC